MKQRNTEKGSVLVIILIGVVLFAALTYVVAQMFRAGETGNLTKEKAQLSGNEILEFSGGLRQGVQDLRISNGCADTDISFETTGLTGYAHSPAVPDNCKVFSSDGAGLTYVAPQDEWLDDNKIASPTFGQYVFVRKLAVDSIGTTNTDLAVVLNYVRKDVCLSINDHLGIANTNGIPPKDVGTFHSVEQFNGTYDTTSDLVNATETTGKTAACVQSADGSNNMFYQVLISR